MQPNYHETCSKTFIKAAFASIAAQNDFEIFSLVAIMRSTSINDLPTWVPDFTIKLPRGVGSFGRSNFYSRLALPTKPMQSALPQLSSDNGLLTVYGSSLGQVVSFMTLPEDFDYFPSDFWKDALTQLKVSFTIRDLRAELAREAWPIDNFIPSQPGIYAYERWRTENVIQAVFAFWDEIAGSKASYSGSRMPFWACSDAERKRRGYGYAESDSNYFMFLEYANFVGGGAVLYITSSGHIGLASKTAVVGDHVVILPGCKMQVILRPAGTAYEFRGLAHIHTICGQSIDGLENQHLQCRKLVIK
jgi:hypothetical protein